MPQHTVGDASHLMQRLLKGPRVQNDDMHFASPFVGPGKYSPEKPMALFDARPPRSLLHVCAVAGRRASEVPRVVRVVLHSAVDISIKRLKPVGLPVQSPTKFMAHALFSGLCALPYSLA